MFSIRELSQTTGVSTQTIRYYERIHLLPPAKRAANGYRIYREPDIERLQFIRRARALDFTLSEIGEILALRDHHEAPCRYVLDVMQRRIEVIEERIRDMERLKVEVKALYETGQQMPEDVDMRMCVCHLIQISGSKKGN